METISYSGKQRPAQRKEKQRGIALIITLLLLMLMIGMTLAMTIAVTSDTLITRYYREFRSSFYAADSGTNVARTYLLNQLATQAITVGTNYASNAQPPLKTTDVSSALTALNTAYGGGYTSIVGGAGVGSWPSSFEVVGTQSNTIGTTLDGCTMGAGSCTPATPSCTVSFTTPTSGTMNTAPTGGYTCTGTVPICTGTCTGFSAAFQYIFPYTITTTGEATGTEQQLVEDAGNLKITVNIGTATSYTQSFAAWGMFIDQFPECTDGDLVAGTITGPVFTNGAWTFGDSGSYTFTGKVSSVSPTFGYDFGTCYASSATSYKSGGQTIAPTFQSSYSLGANAIALPTNSYNQKEAVVDGIGNTWAANNETAAQQDAAMNAALKTVSGTAGTAYPSAGTTNPGVYMAYSSTTTGGVTTNTMTGGGIYVEGTATSVELTASNPTVSGATHADQIFTISQTSGSTTTVTTITEDLTSLSTSVSSAATTTTTTGSGKNQKTTTTTTTTTTNISGLPELRTGSSPSPATMLYVDGAIGNESSTGLSGPGQGVAAIQNGAAITITATGNIDVTGDVLYKTEPVTTTQNQIPNTPVDTLISANNYGQVLGLFTPTGNINLWNQQTGNNNLEVDGCLATISSGGSGGLVNPGNSINTLTIVGGRIQNTIQNIGTTTRNVYFDQRFATGFSPPWFPSTTISPTATDAVTSVTSTVSRTQWLSVY